VAPNEEYLKLFKFPAPNSSVFINVVDLSKKRCFHGGAGVDNEVICNGYIRKGSVARRLGSRLPAINCLRPVL